MRRSELVNLSVFDVDAERRSSFENLLFLLMTPSSQELEPPRNPGRFIAEAAPPAKADPSKPAQIPGRLQREFPGQHQGKSLDQIKTELKTAEGAEKQSLQKAKKIIEQAERPQQKTKSK